MTSSGHKSVRPLFQGICEKIVKTFLLEGNIRVPVCLSSTSSQLEVEPLPLTTPIVYIRYKDTNFSEIEKIGMGMAMKNRYPQEVLERCHVLCNTTWAYHQDGDVQKLLEEFLIAIDNSSQVPDALKDIFKLYKRGGNKLGMEHNLYMQMLEISCQLYFGQVVPAEAFTCDEKKLLKRRQKVAAVVNYLLPKLFDLLKVNGEKVFRATNENIHCTTSWATGADKDRLSSQIVVTNYISNDAPWEDTLPIPVHPNGKTRKKIFDNNFSEKAKKTGRQIFRKNVERCMKEQRLELLDTNNIILPRGQAEELLIELRFVCFATVKDPSNDNHGEKDDSPFLFKIFIYPPTKSVLFLHSPLSIGLDSRECIPLEKSLARLEGAEMMKLMFRGLQTGNEYCSGAKILQSQNQNDAIFAGFALESITKCFHQNKRIACAAGRDVLTGNSINALAQNTLFKRMDHISGISRKGRMAHHRVNPEEGCAVDQLILVRSVNILSNHGLPKDFGRYPLTPKEMDRQSLPSMCDKVDNHLSSKCDAGTKSKRWSCLLKKVATEKLKTIIRNIRTLKLKATKGNHLATGQTFKEIAKNNDVLKDYYKNSKPFWVRAGKATGSEVGVVPDFGAIETNLTNATKVGKFVSGHTAAGIKEKFNNRKTKAKKQKTKHQRVEKPPANIFCNKLWKVFVDESGVVIRGGKPVSTYNNFQPPITNGMTFYLCRFDEQGNNHE